MRSKSVNRKQSFVLYIFILVHLLTKTKSSAWSSFYNASYHCKYKMCILGTSTPVQNRVF